MTLPSNIRTNWSAPFPSKVRASGPCTLSKSNGIWSFGFSLAGLGAIQSLDPTNIEIAVWNVTLQVWQQATLQQLLGGSFVQRLVTGAGNVVVQSNDRVLLIKQAAPAAANIILPSAQSRNSVPITVKDLAGVAAANNLTLVPNGSETIDGAANFVLNDNFETVTLNPITAQGGPAGWWIG